MDKFICKNGASLYYLRTGEGMGGFLNPPDHAEHSTSIIEKRGGHETGSWCLSYALTCNYIPEPVKSEARRELNLHPGKPTLEWVKSIWRYFKHCYSKDGENRNVSDCAVVGLNCAKGTYGYNKHLAHLFVRSFFPKTK